MKVTRLADLRREYSRQTLSKAAVDRDPFQQFGSWMDAALKADVVEPTAMTLATVDASCRPSTRVVLLKGFDEKGFVFFTNYESRKGTELLANPNGAIHFFWPDLERQVSVLGTTHKIPTEESEAYFRSRPHESQLGAWASRQSSIIDSRKVLEDRMSEVRSTYGEGEVPLPLFWGGFRLSPYSFEFWQGRENRLHDRICYEWKNGKWTIFRRSP